MYCKIKWHVMDQSIGCSSFGERAVNDENNYQPCVLASVRLLRNVWGKQMSRTGNLSHTFIWQKTQVTIWLITLETGKPLSGNTLSRLKRTQQQLLFKQLLGRSVSPEQPAIYTTVCLLFCLKTRHCPSPVALSLECDVLLCFAARSLSPAPP